jgi:uncharacterized membrane protein YfcA
MSIEPLLILELALLGCCTGFLAGLLGIGGGMLMVPFLTILLDIKGFPHEYGVKMAVATSLATICFTSLTSVWAHHKRGAVLWPVVLRLTPGILLGSMLGSQLAVALPAKILGVMFAIFITFSATQMFLDRKPKPGRALPGWIGTSSFGMLIGGLASLVGAGGAFVSVPFMTWCNVKIHNAVATSAALGFPIAAAGTIGYVIAGWSLPDMPAGALGFLYVPALLTISAASVLTAPMGARAAHTLDRRKLQRVFAALLYSLAAYMFYKALNA